MADFDLYKRLEVARVAQNADLSNAAGPVAQSHTREERYRIANMSANLAEDPIGQVTYKANLVSAKVVPQKSWVANATDYSVITLTKRTGNGAAVTMGSANLSGVAGTLFVPVSLTLVANTANTQIAAGDVLSLTSVNTGNGIANNGVGCLCLCFEDV